MVDRYRVLIISTVLLGRSCFDQKPFDVLYAVSVERRCMMGLGMMAKLGT